MILITGGSSSGKSEFAEQLVYKMGGQRLYLATGKVTDEEMAARVLKHRRRRGSSWETIEGNPSMDPAVYKEYDGILLDSVTTWVTNLLFASFEQDGRFVEPDWFKVDYQQIEEKIMNSVRIFAKMAQTHRFPIVVVTDETGLGVVPDTALGRGFRDILGHVNQLLAGMADDVYFVVSGIPMHIKG